MSQATFLVKIDVPSGSSIEGLAEEIHDLLADDLAVIEVNPWARPSEGIEPQADNTQGPLDVTSPLLPTL
jgi:hypothetical protein